MNEGRSVIRDIRTVLELDRRVDFHHNPIEFGLEDGTLVLAGEVGSVATKKLVLEYAAALAGERAIDDRLLVRPGEVVEDEELCSLVFDALEAESAFNDTALRAWVGQTVKAGRQTPRGSADHIELLVQEGVVTLGGQVESYAHKALAGVLAWWRRGTRNVVNNLMVDHPMDDPDGEMTDALRMVLEKDRLVSMAQIRAICRDFTATLTGAVKSEVERRLAEADAWYLFGVNEVDNRLAVL